MNKKELKSFHYNNQNEIQFEYGGQTHHYSMECLKDIICNYFNNLKEIYRLNNIINELGKYVKENGRKVIDKYNFIIAEDELIYVDDILDKLKELKEGDKE